MLKAGRSNEIETPIIDDDPYDTCNEEKRQIDDNPELCQEEEIEDIDENVPISISNYNERTYPSRIRKPLDYFQSYHVSNNNEPKPIQMQYDNRQKAMELEYNSLT